MKLLLDHGADPSIPTDHKVTPLMVASGIGWVEGVTYEWSPEQTLEAVKMLLKLGADVNAQDDLDGRTALMGAAHKGRNDVVQLLADHGANLALHDIGSRDSIHALLRPHLAGHRLRRRSRARRRAVSRLVTPKHPGCFVNS